MRKLLTVLAGLLLAGTAYAQDSGRGLVDHVDTSGLTCEADLEGYRVYDTALGHEVTCNGTSWVASGGVGDFERTAYFPVGTGTVRADAIQCAAPAQANINNVMFFSSICTDNDASSLYWEMAMPDNWDLGTMKVKVFTTSVTNPPTGNMHSDVSVACRGDDEVINTTFGDEQPLDITGYDTRYGLLYAESAAITPNCFTACTVHDMCYFRWQLDAAGTTTAAADLHILGFQVSYTVTDFDEVD